MTFSSASCRSPSIERAHTGLKFSFVFMVCQKPRLAAICLSISKEPSMIFRSVLIATFPRNNIGIGTLISEGITRADVGCPYPHCSKAVAQRLVCALAPSVTATVIPSNESLRTPARIRATERSQHREYIIEIDDVVSGARWSDVAVHARCVVGEPGDDAQDVVEVRRLGW